MVKIDSLQTDVKVRDRNVKAEVWATQDMCSLEKTLAFKQRFALELL